MTFVGFEKLPKRKKKPKVQVSNKSKIWTEKLLIPINSNLKRNGSGVRLFPSQTKFRCLELLRKEYAHPSRINTVILWFCKNYKWKYCPKIFSISEFAQKFAKIEIVMFRWKKENPSVKLRQKYIDMAEDKFGVCEYSIRDWSPLFVERFPLALQLTSDNYAKFANWIYSQLNLVGYYNYIDHPDIFAYEWFHELDEWFLENSDRRKIDPLKLIFSISNRRTIRYLYKWCEDRVLGISPIEFVRQFRNSSFNNEEYPEKGVEIEIPYYKEWTEPGCC
jgi:hypothetical protein